MGLEAVNLQKLKAVGYTVGLAAYEDALLRDSELCELLIGFEKLYQAEVKASVLYRVSGQSYKIPVTQARINLSRYIIDRLLHEQDFDALTFQKRLLAADPDTVAIALKRKSSNPDAMRKYIKDVLAGKIGALLQQFANLYGLRHGIQHESYQEPSCWSRIYYAMHACAAGLRKPPEGYLPLAGDSVRNSVELSSISDAILSNKPR